LLDDLAIAVLPITRTDESLLTVYRGAS